MNAFRIAALLCVCACASILAQQTNVAETTTLTIDGVTYSNAHWGAVSPSSVTILHKSGVASIPLEKLSPELQKQFGYDPQRASQYRAAEQRAAQQQAIVNQRLFAEENAKQQKQAAAQVKEQSEQAAPETAQTNATAARQEQQITGAFGVTLGTTVNLSQYQKTGETTGKTPLYGFSPANPIQGLTTYWFQATPKTGIIYRVWAQGDCENNDVCKKRQAVILDLLNKKYGQEDKEGLFDDLYDMKRMTRGNRSIVLKCTGILDVSLNLYYTDEDLEKQAEKERIELEGGDTDKNGL